MSEENTAVPNRVSDLSEDDKPRERALSLGVSSLSNSELIAITLGSGLPGKSVLQLSREIMRDCDNNLGNLRRKSIKDLMKSYKGVGAAKAVSLAAALELGMRASEACAGEKRDVITSAGDVFGIMRNRLRLEVEEVWLLCLDRRNRVKDKMLVSRGGTSSSVVDPKVLFKMAVDCMASAVIMVHNHPSGNLRPSADDDRLTVRIKDGGKLLDIRLLDHVIVTDGGYYSYADEGRI